MSSTNKTANYELSQFVGTDIPSILGDWNGDMRKIDAAIAEVASSAGSSASSVSALAGRVTTAENNIQTLEGAQTVTNQRSVQNQVAITAIQGEIPEEASSENKLVTKSQLDAVSADVADINGVIPASASQSNKLATMEDISGISPATFNKASADFTSTNTIKESIDSLISNIATKGGNWNNDDLWQMCVLKLHMITNPSSSSFNDQFNFNLKLASADSTTKIFTGTTHNTGSTGATGILNVEVSMGTTGVDWSEASVTKVILTKIADSDSAITVTDITSLHPVMDNYHEAYLYC